MFDRLIQAATGWLTTAATTTQDNRYLDIPREELVRFQELEQRFNGLMRQRFMLDAEARAVITDLSNCILTIYGIVWSGVVISLLTCKDVVRVSMLLGCMFVCALFIPLILAWGGGLKSKEELCSHLRVQELSFLKDLELYNESGGFTFSETLEPTTDVVKCHVGSLKKRENHVSEQVLDRLLVKRYHVTYFKVLGGAILIALLMPLIVFLVREYVPGGFLLSADRCKLT